MNFLFENLASLTDSFLCVYFITKFCNSSFNVHKNKYYIPATILIFTYTIFSDHFLSGFNFLSTFIFLLLYIIYALLISNRHYGKALLAAIIFEVTLVLLSSLLYITLSLFVNNLEELMQGTDSYARYIYLLMHKVALTAILKVILFFFKNDRLLDIKNTILTFFFSLTTILGLGTAIKVIGTVNSENLSIQMLAISIAFVIVNIILYVLIYQIQKLLQDKYELKLLDEKMAFDKSRLNDAYTIWDNIRKIRHDIKQHLTIVSGFLEENKTNECKNYICNLLPNVDSLGNLITSDNKILDYLINSKLGNLNNTQVIISGSIGDLSDIKEFDLTCLFGNILDNAIEAIENLKEKRIEIMFLRQNSNRVIICKNTIEKSVLKHNKELKTTKKFGDAHGYGTKITAKIVSDYHGMIDYFEELDMFGVQIILPDPISIDTNK